MANARPNTDDSVLIRTTKTEWLAGKHVVPGPWQGEGQQEYCASHRGFWPRKAETSKKIPLLTVDHSNGLDLPSILTTRPFPLQLRRTHFTPSAWNVLYLCALTAVCF